MAERNPVMPAGWEEDDFLIDPPKSAPCSIYVTGFQAATTSEDLIIHFQKKRNGGDDVDSIVMSKHRAAVITFKSPEGKMFVAN